MKRINNPTLEQLLAIPHGIEVRVKIHDKQGRAIINNIGRLDGVYFCQNFIEGQECEFKFGKKYSYVISFRPYCVKWIEIGKQVSLQSYCSPEDEPIIDLIENIVQQRLNKYEGFADIFSIKKFKWNDKTGWN